jgi:cobyrinic acid a,c-diamide synthase
MTRAPGLIIAAPASGSGKTLVTLGLLRALRNQGIVARGIKAGPDYIDPGFHTAATGHPAFNLDPWAMRTGTLARLIADSERTAERIIAEGVMGLFDGANLPGRPDAGSTGDLAAMSGWPVVLVIDAAKQAASAAALLSGFARHRSDVHVAGVVFNRVGSASHAQVLRDAVAMACPDIKVLGCLPRMSELVLPARHLGLVQAGEHGALEDFIETASGLVSQTIDLNALVAMAQPGRERHSPCDDPLQIPVLGQHMAVARDEAFAFAYPSVLEGWRNSGANLTFFSPLADEAPDRHADAIYLPGGYPELHGPQLAAARRFRTGLQEAAARHATIYGECGGYMALGQGLIDGDGKWHEMAGLLPVETSFADRKLHLGYRVIESLAPSALGPAGVRYRGHEFHYATITSENNAAPLFHARNARGDDLGSCGMTLGSVSGSFVHLIDREAA